MRARPRLSPRRILALWRMYEAELRIDAEARSRAGKTPGKLPGGLKPETGRVRDEIGAIAGVSGRTAEKCNEVYLAAEREPALFEPVAAYLDRSANIHDAHKRMVRVADLERVSRLAAITGKFATLVLDPPWQDESVSENQRPPYATMTVDEIAAVPVPSWVGEKAHIYCHAPGPWVPTAVDLIQGWGFAFKTLITWRKPRVSQGRYFRPRTEFVVFGTRGGLMLARQDLKSDFDAPAGTHSEKPEEFYSLVRKASPPLYGEAFGRRDRPDFTPLYGPAPMREAAE